MTVAPTKLPLDSKAIWAEVERVQSRARTRKLEESQVELFVYLCNQAIKVCEKYEVSKSAIQVEITGGAVCNSYGRHSAESSVIRCEAEMKKDDSGTYQPTGDIEIVVKRDSAKHRPWGVDKPHARIRVPASHPSRQSMKEAGLIEDSDQYARVYRG